MNIYPPKSNSIGLQQKSVVLILLFLACLLGLIFAGINFYRELITLACVELGMSVICSYLFVKTRRVSMDITAFKRVSYIYLSVFFLVLVFAISYSKVSSVSTWIMLSPLISYFLLERDIAKIATFFMSTFLLALFTYKSLNGYSSFETYISLVDYSLFLLNIYLTFMVIWFIIHNYIQREFNNHQRLLNMAMRDQLTGLYNRTALQNCFAQTKNLSKLCMVILDIDWFKKINDTYGHDIGDHALQVLSQQLINEFEDIGYIIRLGGEEFAVILPDTDILIGTELIESFLEHFRKVSIQSEDEVFNMTFSAGIAEYPLEAESIQELQKLADRRLYNAKDHGRNCVCRWHK